jgi:hypothetical protein
VLSVVYELLAGVLNALFLAAQTAIEIESLYKGINFLSVLICARSEELCGDL